jgi:hypothetical protein
MLAPSSDEIRRELQKRLFGQKIVQNNFRGEVVEEIVAAALCRNEVRCWTHCSADWSSWDFERGDIRLQVRQSARCQSWDRDSQGVPRNRQCSFSIKLNSGFYQGAVWKALKQKCHLAQIYIFGCHEDGIETADQFDARQWKFYLMSASDLPIERISISEKQLRENVKAGIAKSADFSTLYEILEGLASMVEPKELASYECKGP